MERPAVEIDDKDGEISWTIIFSTVVPPDDQAEKLAKLLPLIISKIIQRELQENFKNTGGHVTIDMLSSAKE